MIYTSYFGNIPNLKKLGIIPIAICGGLPEDYNGKWYRKLAPSWSIYSQYKETGKCDVYINRYINEILNKLNSQIVYSNLCNLAGRKYDFALICYEKLGRFCHRHLVSNWLNQNNIPCQEWNDT
jgi:uncharacterized protein YeaO (DUF488 family)